MKEMGKMREKMKEESKSSVVSINQKFESVSDQSNIFKNVGLVSMEDFKNNVAASITAEILSPSSEKKRLNTTDSLAKLWTEQQDKIKSEAIEITYSYWDGSGHRRSLQCTKGTTISKFLELARLEFKELRGVSVDHLMFIKEDLIIPHMYSFYDLIIEKARGKSGPLFKFDVHEDIRLVNDASVEKDETHAGKVVEKSWTNYTISDKMAKN
eukprot:gene16761-19929_t